MLMNLFPRKGVQREIFFLEDKPAGEKNKKNPGDAAGRRDFRSRPVSAARLRIRVKSLSLHPQAEWVQPVRPSAEEAA